MTQDETIELGFRAEALLKSKTFQLVINRLGEDYANALLLSKPHERNFREDNYNLHRALNDIVGQLGAFVAAKDALAQQLEDKEAVNAR